MVRRVSGDVDGVMRYGRGCEKETETCRIRTYHCFILSTALTDLRGF